MWFGEYSASECLSLEELLLPPALSNARSGLRSRVRGNRCRSGRGRPATPLVDDGKKIT
jgi:hypothetical protein